MVVAVTSVALTVLVVVDAWGGLAALTAAVEETGEGMAREMAVAKAAVRAAVPEPSRYIDRRPNTAAPAPAGP